MLREYIEKRTACIRIRIGDKLRYEDGRVGILKAIELAPNGCDEPKIVALLTVKMEMSVVNATSDKFTPVHGEQYLDG